MSRPYSDPDLERMAQQFDAVAAKLRSVKPLPIEEAKRNYRRHQRAVLEALLAEGQSPRQILRTYPRLDWTVEEIDALREGL